MNIEGVRVKQMTLHQDIPDTDDGVAKEGFLMEVLRDDDGLLRRFGQTTFTVAYTDTIKAFHWHKKQDDLWFVASGKAVIVLYDLRRDSPTHGVTQTLTAGVDDYKLILIPEGVAHGYKVVSREPVLLFYHTTESYDPQDPDEERIASDDASIAFDWEAVS
ncbi:MAG: dTDP-4-dehydrorhamnose 3,5-epimerase family protein [Candidatus Marinimicrobia bacterium]|nr:dTDP-4-dehydrorhamnose 3,5-epimerase family protein [Candidatus Neomarinimicrobiota bacterium]MDP6593656.1 dTDP-4-dehydrorhamnose 3,5-epimerase family protein [Candidatus Neomarinimicrobiota bacterium]MDP6836206.1 dTDP-4-dehydrorhamnose 3,5-epimerase family protein [Candidatus Neomarinimicrobiota bacterium]MDP6966079.1 dTDP-4-dehydrorhamnose 3,5-epimerase family protein [Candidatus Neomarinimicrobiota bacterium]